METFALNEKDRETVIKALETALWSGAWVAWQQDFTSLLYRLRHNITEEGEHETKARDSNG